MNRGGNFSVSFTAEEFDTLERLSLETGLTRNRIMKTALKHFATTNMVRELKKAKVRKVIT